MGEDETGTLAALKQHLTGLIAPTIAEHQGRIFKLMGDGVLAEFATALLMRLNVRLGGRGW